MKYDKTQIVRWAITVPEGRNGLETSLGRGDDDERDRWPAQGCEARFASASPGRLDGADVDLAHRHHRLEDAL